MAFLVALNIICSNFSDVDDLLLQEVEEVVADGRKSFQLLSIFAVTVLNNNYAIPSPQKRTMSV